MKCRSREESINGRNAVDELLADVMPKYIALFPNLSKDMAKILEQKGMYEGLIGGILGSAIQTTDLIEIEELGLFLQTLYVVCLNYQETAVKAKHLKSIYKLEELNPELYYESTELSSMNLYSRDMEEDGNIVKLFVFKNAENHYTCPNCTLNQYVKYFNRGAFTYNINTQRDTTKTISKKTHQVTEKITIFRKNISKMVQALQDDMFFPTTLLLSIRENGHEKYDDGGMKVGEYGWLKIEVGGESYLDINDGMNRSLAFKEFVELKPDNNEYTGLSIFKCDEEKALRIIKQANEGEKIKIETLERKDPDNAGVRIAKDLKEKSKKLRGKMAIDLIDIIAHNNYTDILTLGDTINLIFPETQERPTKVLELTKFLSQFFDLAIDYYDDYFNKKLIAKPDLYQRKNLFSTLCCVAHYLQDTEDWESKLLEILNEVTIDGFLEITSTKKKLKTTDIKIINNKVNKLLGVKSEVAM